MFIADTGNVGIGTLSPGAKLHAVATGLGGTAVLGVGSGFGAGVKGQSSLGAAIYADGNAGQTREKGGFAKAMLFVRSDGVITRGFNSYLSGDAATTPPCGFSVEKIGQFTGVAYIIGFGFRVDDRFVSVTPSPLVTYYGLGSQGADQSKIRLDSGSTDFTVILY